MLKMSGMGLAALAILVSACASTPSEVAGVDEVSESVPEVVAEFDADPADEPEAEVVEEESTNGEAEQDDIAPVERSRVEPPDFPATEFLADAPLLLDAFNVVEAGDHRVLSVGTELSFKNADTLAVQPNFTGHFVITDFDSRGPDDQDIVFLRTTNLSDPTQPWTPRDGQEPWPVDDVAGWVDNLADDIIATAPVETTLGGLDAIYLELALAEGAQCGYAEGVCIGFAENDNTNIKGLSPGSLYRVWVVDQGGEDPIVVTAGIQTEDDIVWFDRAEELLSTLAFGEVETNPVRRLPAGPTDLPALGGIEIAFAQEQTVFQTWNDRGYLATEFGSSITALGFASAPRSLTGEVFATSDELIATLTDAGIELTEGEVTLVGGIETRTFDYTSTDAREIFFKFSEIEVSAIGFGWEPGLAGRLWTIDHPERGLQVISAKAFGAIDSQLPELLTNSEEIIASIQYVDAN